MGGGVRIQGRQSQAQGGMILALGGKKVPGGCWQHSREGLNSHRMPKDSDPLIGKHRLQRCHPCPTIRQIRGGQSRHGRLVVCLYTAPVFTLWNGWGEKNSHKNMVCQRKRFDFPEENTAIAVPRSSRSPGF